MTDTELTARLERLERDNRRLKRLGSAALVLATALRAIYASRPVPEKITAREFDLVDSRGTVRAKLKMEPPRPTSLSNAIRSVIPGVTLQPSPQLYMEAGFVKDGQAGIARTVLGADSLMMSALGAGEFGTVYLGQGLLIIAGENPSVRLSDGQGFEMDLGRTETVTPRTGVTRSTSANSIVMFGNDKDHHVIWQAP